MEVTLLDENSHNGSHIKKVLDLSYNTGRLQSLNEALFSNFQLSQLCDGSWVHGSLIV